jgi:hypothetical protein
VRRLSGCIATMASRLASYSPGDGELMISSSNSARSVDQACHAANSSSSAFASFRSRVSNPLVNQP